jgi:3-hydroxyisobutyrate dehydrogenase-like beta-hydroxyacid dehydrogenase
MNIGFIGLGIMGAPMARHLIDRCGAADAGVRRQRQAGPGSFGACERAGVDGESPELVR